MTTDVQEFGLVQKDKLKDIMREILSLEKERAAVKEDMVERKRSIQTYLPKGLVNKAIKVYMNKGYDNTTVSDYQLICDMLGIPFACDVYMPSEQELNPEQKKCKEALIEGLKAYENLVTENNTITLDIRNLYIQAKYIGVSIPLMKKAIDFCLHPSKLAEYQEGCPLLETYIDISKDID